MNESLVFEESSSLSKVCSSYSPTTISSTSPLSTQFSMNRSNTSRSPSRERFLLHELDKERNNQVIPQRKRRDFIPNELKDESYWERRRKNNLAAKRSREKRRLNDMVLETKVLEQTNLNNVYKLKLELIMKKYNVDESEMDKLFEENKHLLVITETIEGLLPTDNDDTLNSKKSTSSNGNTSDHSSCSVSCCGDVETTHTHSPPTKIVARTPTPPPPPSQPPAPSQPTITHSKELLNQVKNELVKCQYPLLYNQLCKTLQQQQQQQQVNNVTKETNEMIKMSTKTLVETFIKDYYTNNLNNTENSNRLLLNSQIEKYKNLIQKINGSRLTRKRSLNDSFIQPQIPQQTISSLDDNNHAILMDNINRFYLLNNHHLNGFNSNTITINDTNKEMTMKANTLAMHNANDGHMPLKLRFKMHQMKTGEVN